MFKRYLKFILLTLLIILFVDFCVVNREVLSISLFPLPYAATLPKFLLAMLCFAFGVLVAGLVLGLKIASLSRRYNNERKRTQALEDAARLAPYAARGADAGALPLPTAPETNIKAL